MVEADLQKQGGVGRKSIFLRALAGEVGNEFWAGRGLASRAKRQTSSRRSKRVFLIFAHMINAPSVWEGATHAAKGRTAPCNRSATLT